MTDATDGELERRLRKHGSFESRPVMAAGSMIGNWKILAFLGRGGSAEVYRAENAATGMVGALKVLYRFDDKARMRFRREAHLAAELSGAAFPKFYGAGEDSGRLYLAGELLEPMALPRGDAAVASYVLGVSRAVEELHKRGFVHRDVKPANVMMRSSTGECVLIDLGLAKEGGAAPRLRNDTLSVVDGRAVGVGTPGYSAPEQFAGGKIGAAADIHALGVLANACFDGNPPPAWARIIRRSTSSIPEQRYATVAEFARAVRRRYAVRRLICTVAAVLAAVGAVAVCMVAMRKEAPMPREALMKKEAPMKKAPPLQQADPSPPESVALESNAEETKKLIRENIADGVLDAAYDMYRNKAAGATNEMGESLLLDKESAKKLMEQGIFPWL